MSNKYPEWIDQYARATHKAFSNMVPSSWGPIDFFAVYQHLNGTFIVKVAEAVEKLEKLGVPLEKVAASFPSQSTMRTALYFMALEYQDAEPKPREQFKKVVDFL